ncbi:MAG: GGDEF domain-containing protein [Proteobacteria bacterium]|nr:GGDEF domain-containing protein [Pseudomonadota bacterium]
MSDSQKLLMIVALQLGLYGLGWAGAALWLRESRAAFFAMLGFSLMTALGIALLSLREVLPDAHSRTLANLCVLIGLVLLWRAAAAMWNVRVAPTLLYVVPALGAAGTLWGGFIMPDYSVRVSSLLLTCSWVATLSGLSIRRRVQEEFGRLPAGVIAGCGVSVGAVLVWRTASSWWSGALRELDLTLSGNFVPVVVLLSSLALANFALAYSVIARMVRRLEHLSRHDALTGLLNRRAILELIEAEWQRHRRHGTPFALLVLDIDRFKRINDRHGHATGDEVLRLLATAFGGVVRRTDRVGWMGGEEFVVMLVGTDLGQAHQLAERLRDGVAHAAWPADVAADGGVTVSLGLAMPGTGDTGIGDVLARADSALYRAKEGGRNRVVVDTAADVTAAG